MAASERVDRVACCIAGGGPAGVVLGYLLARAGVETRVLEKHGDFLRDFRGDTVHPSTLDVIAELGLLDAFLARPHDELREIRGQINGTVVSVADFSHVPARCKFIALMPQWDFLNFFADAGRALPAFHLEMNADVTDLIEEQGRIVGVRAQTPAGPIDIRATLVVGADGRSSLVRDKAGLQVDDIGVPIDVLWMRLTKRSDDVAQPLGNIVNGRVFVALDRGDYYQCAFVIAKGQFEDIQRAGLPAFHREIVRVAPGLASSVGEIASWDDVKLLTVKIDRLRHWHRPGLLCIGDAAHAMSPMGGIGINLAVQDAVAAANLLAASFASGGPTDADLARVQRRREWPTRVTQRAQSFIQNQVIARVLTADQPIAGVPWPVRLLQRFPILRRVPARLVGIGVRPEHVQSRRV
jgi:2-polyprenyl-6-methoxyphenol hydroxylase-like FAD-dependent oxidoreductase